MAPTRRTVLIIGSGELLNRLPESFSNEYIDVDLYDVADSPLSKSKFLRNFIVLDKAPTEPIQKAVFRNRYHLAKMNYDYYLFADDLIAIEIARKSSDLQLKLKLLPVKKESGIQLAGSKVGFVNLCQSEAIRIPLSFVARSAKEALAKSKSFNTPFLVKADIGGGGSTVKRFTQPLNEQALNIPKSWFPIVVQQEIPGILISVEGFFDSGVLLGWLYSKFDVEGWEFGPSTRRTFLAPLSLDFEADLIALGKASGFHGFANATFIWNEKEKRHYLFEADPRPNGWHQFGAKFGVDWGQLFTNSNELNKPISPVKNIPSTFSLFPRELLYAIDRNKYGQLFSWLTQKPGTWNSRNRLDEIVNLMDRAEVQRAVVRKITGPLRRAHLSLARIFVLVWQSIPTTFRNKLDKLGVRKLLIFLFRV